MKVGVSFRDQSLEFEVDDDRLVGHWSGPSARPERDLRAMALEPLLTPLEFPSVTRAIVPGDRVVIPLDPETPGWSPILSALAACLADSQAESLTVISPAPQPAELPEGVTWIVHDPDDKTQISYLASTSEGQRIYLNRQVTDADIAIPIGFLAYDPSLGYRGPWSAIYPALGDREAWTRQGGRVGPEVPDRDKPSTSLTESSEVSWLLGCQFHVGVLDGVEGPSRVIAGLESAVRLEGMKAVDESWTFLAPERADVVIAGIGNPQGSTTFGDLAAGLATATRLVRRGGKIVALTRLGEGLGPSLKRIRGAENPRSALARLRGREADPDFRAARQIAEAAAWADVYLHSALDPDLAEDLGMIAIGRPEEARKVAAQGSSVVLLSHAERTRAIVEGEGLEVDDSTDA